MIFLIFYCISSYSRLLCKCNYKATVLGKNVTCGGLSVCFGGFFFLLQVKEVQVGVISYLKLPIDVNVIIG